MKAFNLSSAISTVVAGREISVLSLGESGRGRSLVQIPCPPGLEDGVAVTATPAVVKTNGLKTKPKIEAGGGGGDHWVARISTKTSYIRGANGNVSLSPGGEAPALIAKGHGAFGDAGRTGTWDDVIVVVPDGTILRVKPARGEAYFLWFEAHKVSRITWDELQILDLEFDLENRFRI